MDRSTTHPLHTFEQRDSNRSEELRWFVAEGSGVNWLDERILPGTPPISHVGDMCEWLTTTKIRLHWNYRRDLGRRRTHSSIPMDFTLQRINCTVIMEQKSSCSFIRGLVIRHHSDWLECVGFKGTLIPQMRRLIKIFVEGEIGLTFVMIQFFDILLQTGSLHTRLHGLLD